MFRFALGSWIQWVLLPEDKVTGAYSGKDRIVWDNGWVAPFWMVLNYGWMEMRDLPRS